MPRRRKAFDYRPGETLLSHVEGTGMILDPLPKKAKAREPICTCPPAAAHRLGGQRPKLKWAAHDLLVPVCSTCLRALTPGVHRRRQATHVMGLAALPIAALDLEDLADAELLMADPPRPAPEDWAAEVREAMQLLPVVLSEDVLGGAA